VSELELRGFAKKQAGALLPYSKQSDPVFFRLTVDNLLSIIVLNVNNAVNLLSEIVDILGSADGFYKV